MLKKSEWKKLSKQENWKFGRWLIVYSFASHQVHEMPISRTWGGLFVAPPPPPPLSPPPKAQDRRRQVILKSQTQMCYFQVKIWKKSPHYIEDLAIYFWAKFHEDQISRHGADWFWSAIQKLYTAISIFHEEIEYGLTSMKPSTDYTRLLPWKDSTMATHILTVTDCFSKWTSMLVRSFSMNQGFKYHTCSHGSGPWTLIRLIDWVEFNVPWACEQLCKGHGMGCLWLLLPKPNRGGD